MKLEKLGEKTYCIKGRTNIGIYKSSENEVYIIDTGIDKDTGIKILKIIKENNWKVKGIINTHSHADHIGGNKVIQDRENCLVLAYGIEKAVIENPQIEASFLYGASPIDDICNKFVVAPESKALEIDDYEIEGLKHFLLKGHSFEMIGIKTSDDVYFLGDALIGEEMINKHQLFYIFDVGEYLKTLAFLETLEGRFFVVSHAEVMQDIKNLININRKKVEEICEVVCDICKEKRTFEEILQTIFERYHLYMNINQYYLIGTVVKAYLSYVIKLKKVTFTFENNKMFYEIVN